MRPASGPGRSRSATSRFFVVFLGQLTFLPAEIGRVITEPKRTEVSVDRMHALMPGDPRRPSSLPPVYLRRELPAVDPPPARNPRAAGGGGPHVSPSGERAHRGRVADPQRGSFTVVTGRIGAGKTTLLHAVLGLLPRRGALERPCPRPAGHLLVPPRCAFTPQVPRLFSEALRDNLLLGRQEHADAVAEALAAAVLDDDVSGFERGLDTLIGPRGVKLSGGQVQRAAAARMFLGQAELLLFDDLSSALDAATEAELWARLFARRRRYLPRRVPQRGGTRPPTRPPSTTAASSGLSARVWRRGE